MLVGMAILSGLVSKELVQRLIAKRKDIMIESVAYDLIKQEGYQEGVETGTRAGRRQTFIYGLRIMLNMKFGRDGLQMMPRLETIDDPDLLQQIVDKIPTANTPADLLRIIDSYQERKSGKGVSMPGD